MIFVSKNFSSASELGLETFRIAKMVLDYYKLSVRYNFDNRMLLLYKVAADQSITLVSRNIHEFSTYVLNNKGLYQIRTIDIKNLAGRG